MYTRAEPRQRDWATMALVLIVGIAFVLMLYAFWAAPPKIEAVSTGQGPAVQTKQATPSKHLPLNSGRPLP